jgi:acyl carrier protein phosphodiesterase
MNFLAHQFLSFEKEPLQVGNFIADTVKGKAILNYESGIQKGIRLHRFIDSFTDSHPLVLEGRRYLYPHFGKYAGVAQDVYFDHFLAKNWERYHDTPLSEFVELTYKTLSDSSNVFNARALRTFTFMRKQNWLENYATKSGIDKALKGLSSRAVYYSNLENGLAVLEKYEAVINEDFEEFFPDLVHQSKEAIFVI